jgi:hypothetical protein
MMLDDVVKLIEAIGHLMGGVAWPLVAVFIVVLFRSSIGRFLSNLSELRLKGRGFEASAVRRLDFDAISQKLYDFWKPGGNIDRANATRIAACMQQLNIVGSIAWLINAAPPESRTRVAACLKLV